MPQLNPKKIEHFTYADYLTWDDDKRWELIAGQAFCMSPAPGRQHQELSVALSHYLYSWLLDKPCKVYAAPFDVRLIEAKEHAADDYIDTVVQPDIVVVCDPKKLDDKGCIGAPDLIIEILSPSTTRMDMTVKFELYQRHGVKEYWIIHPNDQTVLVFKRLETGLYGVPDRYCADDTIPVTLLGDLQLDLTKVFLPAA
ncbi:MAG TPA: Uma2 family endonuclease [Desulfuromonadales bacterium]|nr:Uma2 family endonuclease [Desulfuromonadales bacterium]